MKEKSIKLALLNTSTPSITISKPLVGNPSSSVNIMSPRPGSTLLNTPESLLRSKQTLMSKFYSKLGTTMLVNTGLIYKPTENNLSITIAEQLVISPNHLFSSSAQAMMPVP